jgi:hypothetical protein
MAGSNRSRDQRSPEVDHSDVRRHDRRVLQLWRAVATGPQVGRLSRADHAELWRDCDRGRCGLALRCSCTGRYCGIPVCVRAYIFVHFVPLPDIRRPRSKGCEQMQALSRLRFVHPLSRCVELIWWHNRTKWQNMPLGHPEAPPNRSGLLYGTRAAFSLAKISRASGDKVSLRGSNSSTIFFTASVWPRASWASPI